MSRPKDIGTRQETRICRAINEWAGEPVCERIPLYGNKDHGDLRIRVGDLVLTGESKHCKRAPGPAMISAFREQTVTENENAGQDGGLLFVNRPQRAIGVMDVHMQRSTYLRLNGIHLIACLPDVPSAALAVISRAMGCGEHDWIRMTMDDFMHLCWGEPALGTGGELEEE